MIRTSIHESSLTLPHLTHLQVVNNDGQLVLYFLSGIASARLSLTFVCDRDVQYSISITHSSTGTDFPYFVWRTASVCENAFWTFESTSLRGILIAGWVLAILLFFGIIYLYFRLRKHEQEVEDKLTLITN